MSWLISSRGRSACIFLAASSLQNIYLAGPPFTAHLLQATWSLPTLSMSESRHVYLSPIFLERQGGCLLVGETSVCINLFDQRSMADRCS